MSDNVQIALIVAVFSTATTLLTIVLNSIASRKAAAQNAELAAQNTAQNTALNTKLQENNEKVDAYHKEVNGNMGKLLETTKDLATAKEKARDKTNDK